MKRTDETGRVWTATDCLDLDVEQVEEWVREVVKDEDPPTPHLVRLVTRLRAAADLLADYLYNTSEPAGGSGSGCGSAAPHRTAAGPEVRGKRRDSEGRPEGVPHRERAERPRTSGTTQSDPPEEVSALHE